MAQKPPVGRAAFAVTDEAFRTTVEIDLDAFYQRLHAETLAAMKEFQQQGLTGKALADAVAQRLRSLSDVPLEMAGRQSTSEAFNLGRNIAAQERKAEIKEVVRTEILDINTCPPCFLLDHSNSGEVYVFRVDLVATSNLFKAGHRLRVHVTSSSFPRFDRNPNTGRPLGQDRPSDLRSAVQTVFHDAEHPSHIVLPVVPRQT